MRRRSQGLDEEPGDGAGPWEEDLARWMAPVLAALGHMGRLRWAPVYLRGLLGPGDRKSVQPMAASGFDVITSLRDDIEIAVESNTPPRAVGRTLNNLCRSQPRMLTHPGPLRSGALRSGDRQRPGTGVERDGELIQVRGSLSPDPVAVRGEARTVIGTLEAGRSDPDGLEARMRADHREGEIGRRVHAGDCDRCRRSPVDSRDTAISAERREVRQCHDEAAPAPTPSDRRRGLIGAVAAGDTADVPVAARGKEGADRREQ